MSEIIESLRDTHPASKRSETLRMIQTALLKGWSVPDVWKDTLPVELHKIAEDPNVLTKERLRAIEVLAMMDAKNKDHLIHVDKQLRLEDGQVTERVEFAPMRF